MCVTIEVRGGLDYIDTIEAAIVAFGEAAIREHNDGEIDNANHCLCSLDFEKLMASRGLTHLKDWKLDWETWA